MGHYLHAYLVGQSILNAFVAWRQILSCKLCVVLLQEEETLECYVVTMVLILWEHKKNLEKAYKEVDHQKIEFFLQNIGADYINWHRNPPASSHVEGVWEKQPICPSNILTMKSKVVLPPPGHFVKADEYSRKRWRHIQHIANEFWVRWRKEFLWSLQQPRHKWNEKHRNFQNGDIVLLKTDANCNQWPMAKVVGINSDAEGFVRSVKLLIGKT